MLISCVTNHSKCTPCVTNHTLFPTETRLVSDDDPTTTARPHPLIPNPFIRSPSTNIKKAAGDCTDDNDQCQEWSFFGECEKNPSFMNVTCRKACALCGSRKKVLQSDTITKA